MLDQGKLAAVRLWTAQRFPYLATAVFATTVVPSDRPGVIAVDAAWRMYLDPHLLDTWSAAQMGSVLVHHVGHLLREHAQRATALGLSRAQAPRWVTAADAEINDDLDDAALESPVEPVTPMLLGLQPHRLAEEYFHALPAIQPGRDCGSGCDGLPRDWDSEGGLDARQRHLLRYQVASEVLQYCRARTPGSVPAGLRRWAEELLGARLDWRAIFRAEIRRGLAVVAGMVDYSYRRPSRRTASVESVILPGFIRRVPEVAVVIDTSGSMDEALLGQALAEVDQLLRTLGGGGRRLRVISCDAAVHGVQRITSARQVELLGGGGTDMGEGIRAAQELNPKPSVVVVLTDGYTPWPQEPPRNTHVVVGLLAEGGQRPPAWARVVQVENE